VRGEVKITERGGVCQEGQVVGGRERCASARGRQRRGGRAAGDQVQAGARRAAAKRINRGRQAEGHRGAQGWRTRGTEVRGKGRTRPAGIQEDVR